MSAFVVSDKTIAGMLQATRQDHYGVYVYWNNESKRIHNHDTSVAAQVLVDENYRSVNYRSGLYGHETVESHTYSDPYVEPLELIQIIKLCNCYAYQSCETDDWKETEAYAICDALKETAIRALPGYENAEWEI